MFGNPAHAMAETTAALTEPTMEMKQNGQTSTLVIGAAIPSSDPSTLAKINNQFLKWDNNQAIDLMRETNLRYLGYANEVGESFNLQFPQFLTPSYAVAYGYCVADSLYKMLHYYFNNAEVVDAGMYAAGADALIFQCFASVLIPGNIIAIIVKQTDNVIKKVEEGQDLPEAVTKWGPTFVGLATIPFIVHPIDESVGFIMDHSIRILY